ncbi:HAD family phosphatase [Candidatus Micrarchaeota archaeon]|nr:HAD family phosphatase [Candidatus Micrarchaeota archaeon]
MIKAILFDFDGSVVDSEPLHLRSFRELLKPLGIKISKARHYSEFTGIGSTAIITMLFQEHGINENVKEWVEKRKKIYQSYVLKGKLKTISGVRKFLQFIKKRKIKTAIVSGGHSTNIKLALEKTKLTKFFDVIIGLENVKNRKPHPEGFLLAAQRLNVKPSECIAIEDAPAGVLAAHAAKMRVVCIRSLAPVDLKKCDYTIKNYARFPMELF